MTPSRSIGDRLHEAPPGDPDLARLGTTLAVWAHPDDETYLSGGLLAGLRDAGQRVVCVTATRGEAGEDPDSGAPRTRLTARRSRELAAALAVLGVQEHQWLDYPDGGCATVDAAEATDRLASIIAAVAPDTVVSFGPDGFTGHPDHRAVARWTERAVCGSSSGPRLLQAVMTPEDREAGRAIDDRFAVYELGEPRLCPAADVTVRLVLRGAQLARKVSALRCQRSQTAPLIEALGTHSFGMWVSTESFLDAGRGDARQ